MPRSVNMCSGVPNNVIQCLMNALTHSLAEMFGRGTTFTKGGLVDYYEKIVVTLVVSQRSGYVYIHVGEATTWWWGDVDKRGNVVTLDFTAAQA